MPYFTQERMRENCDCGIFGVGCGSGVPESGTSPSLLAGPAIICSTRGLRSVGDGGALSLTAGLARRSAEHKVAILAPPKTDIRSPLFDVGLTVGNYAISDGSMTIAPRDKLIGMMAARRR
jgi:hypothetical protein